MSAAVQQHFVVFYSPGTFFAETTQKPVESWDVGQARQMAATVLERHGAVPYGFCFVTRGRSANELDSRELNRSGMYYLSGKVETLDQIEARADPGESILLSNMRSNGYSRVVTSTRGWRWTQPLQEGDVVLEPEE